MNITPKLSWLLLFCVLFMVLITVWSRKSFSEDQNEFPSKMGYRKRLNSDRRSHIRRFRIGNGNHEDDDDDGYKNRGKTQRIHIHMTNMDEQEQQEHKKNQQVKQALMKMMNKKFKETKTGSKQRRHFNNAPGIDFRREFASDEPNPYIENLCNCCE